MHDGMEEEYDAYPGVCGGTDGLSSLRVDHCVSTDPLEDCEHGQYEHLYEDPGVKDEDAVA